MQQNSWSSKLTFILAAAGCAIGLGNIWRFPFVSAEQGGGNFIVLYMVFLVLIGLPLFMSEALLGRLSKNHNLLESLNKLKGGLSKISLLFVLVPLLLMSYYIVIGGWSVFYLFISIFGQIDYSPTNDSQYYVSTLNTMMASPLFISLSSLAIIVITGIINIRGVTSGIEKANNLMIPALFAILIVLAIRVLTLDGVEEGLKYYFSFNLSAITAQNVYTAMGQAIFSLSIGSGTIYVYGSYLKKETNMPQSALAVGILGSLVGILSGMIIVPALFVFNYPLDTGPSLAFITLPAIFSKMSYGIIFALLFFFIMLMAVITTTISLVEQLVPVFMAKLSISRTKAVIVACLIIYFLSLFQGFSFNILADVKLFGKNIFDISDYLVSNVFLCVGSIIFSLYAAYVIKNTMLKEINSDGLYNFPWAKVWLFALKGPIPIVMVFVMLKGMGVF